MSKSLLYVESFADRKSRDLTQRELREANCMIVHARCLTTNLDGDWHMEFAPWHPQPSVQEVLAILHTASTSGTDLNRRQYRW